LTAIPGSEPAAFCEAKNAAGSAKCSAEKLACSFFKQAEERSDILFSLHFYERMEEVLA